MGITGATHRSRQEQKELVRQMAMLRKSNLRIHMQNSAVQLFGKVDKSRKEKGRYKKSRHGGGVATSEENVGER